MTSSSFLKSINYFNCHENVILCSYKDKQGNEGLKCIKKGFLSFIAIKILHLKSFQLQTIVRIVKEQSTHFKSSSEQLLLNKFYDKINIKIAKYNDRNSIPLFEKVNDLTHTIQQQPNTTISEPIISQFNIPQAPSILEFERIQKETESNSFGKKASEAYSIISPEEIAKKNNEKEVKKQEGETDNLGSNALSDNPQKNQDEEHFKPFADLYEVKLPIPKIKTSLELNKENINVAKNIEDNVVPVPQKNEAPDQIEQPIPLQLQKQFKELVCSEEDLIHFFQFQFSDRLFQDILQDYQKFKRGSKNAIDGLKSNFELEMRIQESKLKDFKKELTFSKVQEALEGIKVYLKKPLDIEKFYFLERTLRPLLNENDKEKMHNDPFYAKLTREKKQCIEERFSLLHTAFYNNFIEISLEQLCKYLINEIIYKPDSIIASLIIDKSCEHLKQAIAWGINDGIVSSLQIRVLKIIVNEIKNCEMEWVEKAFFERLDYVRENKISFSPLYNNPYLSDQKFIIGAETFYVHKAIVRSIPALQKFSIQHEELVVINENPNDVKLDLEIAYDRFHFDHFKDEYKNLLLCKRYLPKLFNNSECSDFLIESKTGEKLYTHKAILECSDLDFFKAIFKNNLKENREAKLVIEQEEFDVLKVILEYIYTNVMPEFDNAESKQAFEEKLIYYRGGI